MLCNDNKGTHRHTKFDLRQSAEVEIQGIIKEGIFVINWPIHPANLLIKEQLQN